jgi:hypothetical protein
MRFVLAFIVFVVAWQVIAEVGQGRGDLGLNLTGLTSFFDSGRVSDDAPNWGDVAKKIGELSKERATLSQGLADGAPKAKPEPAGN